MTDETVVVDRQLKEKVWHTIANGTLRGVKETGAPLWAIIQLWLLWEIYQKLDAVQMVLHQLSLR